MATSLTLIDELVDDYLQYRNLISTSRSFQQEIPKSSLSQIRADRLIEQLTLYIQQFDLTNLHDYWTQIEQRLLLKTTSTLTKIRLHLYRCYLIHSVQSSRMDKISEFYDRFGKTLQMSSDWSKEWFALPFISNPETDRYFQMFFSKQWSEMFWKSLQNILSVAIYHMSLPKIATEYDEHSSPSVVDLKQENLLSKLRDRFAPNLSIESRNSLPIFVSPVKKSEPIQQSTMGNQIRLFTD